MLEVFKTSRDNMTDFLWLLLFFINDHTYYRLSITNCLDKSIVLVDTSMATTGWMSTTEGVPDPDLTTSYLCSGAHHMAAMVSWSTTKVLPCKARSSITCHGDQSQSARASLAITFTTSLTTEILHLN